MARLEQSGDFKLVSITKAGAIGNTAPRDVTIQIYDEPDDNMSIAEARTFYEQQAALLFDALSNALPGGTFDELLALMMKKRASLFMIPLFDGKEN